MTPVDRFDMVVSVARLGLESSGEGVETLERYVARAAAALGIEVRFVVLAEQVVVTEVAGGITQRLAIVRANPGIFRLDQLAALDRVLDDLEGGLEPEVASERLDAIERSKPRWPPWARVIGVACFAAGFAPSVVASWNEVAAAAILGLLMGVLLVATAGTRVEPLLPFVGAFVVTLLGLTVLSGLATETGVALLVIPALFITVPGDTLSAAAAELLAGSLSTGAVRLLYGLFVLSLIVIGIVAAAGVTGHMDALKETLPPPELSVGVVLAGWVVFCVGLVLAFNAQPSVTVWLVPTVIATYLLQQGATRVGGSIVGTLVAGAALGAFASVVAQQANRPPRLVLLLGGFFVLTVGGVGVRGVTALIGGDVVSGLSNLIEFGVQMPTVALALAVGVVLASRLRPSHLGAG